MEAQSHGPPPVTDAGATSCHRALHSWPCCVAITLEPHRRANMMTKEAPVRSALSPGEAGGGWEQEFKAGL